MISVSKRSKTCEHQNYRLKSLFFSYLQYSLAMFQFQSQFFFFRYLQIATFSMEQSLNTSTVTQTVMMSKEILNLLMELKLHQNKKILLIIQIIKLCKVQVTLLLVFIKMRKLQMLIHYKPLTEKLITLLHQLIKRAMDKVQKKCSYKAN